MYKMFYLNTSFDQNLASWDVTSLTNASQMFDGATLSTANYDSLLNGWNAQTLHSGVSFHGGNSHYCNGESARQNMISSDNWSITDAGKKCPPADPIVAPDLQPTSDTGSSNSDDITSDNTPTFDVVCSEAGNTITLYTDNPAPNTSIGTHVCVGVGTESITSSSNLADGIHNITYTDSKAGAESGHSPSLVVTVDTTAPSASAVAPDLQSASDTGSSDTDNITNDTTPSFDVECTEAGSIITLYTDNPVANTSAGTHVCSGIGTETLDANTLPEGSHTFTYTETDSAGNESGSSPSLDVVIDATGSNLTVDSGSNGDPVTGTGEVGATIDITTPSGATCTTTVASDGTYSCVLMPVPIDGETMTIIQTDIAGNQITITGEIDIDGISLEEEDAGPNNGDMNGDGVLDSAQSNVATYNNPNVNGYTSTVTSGDCERITEVSYYMEPDMALQDSDFEYKLGLHGVKLNCNSVGGTATITHYWDELYDTSKWKYRKYLGDDKGYIDFNDQVTYGTANVGDKTVTTVTFTITDGGKYDTDGVANGIIEDPVGPATTATTKGSGSIGNTIWLDRNGNGKKDKGEPGLKGIHLKLKDDKGKVIDKTKTNHNGHYLFENLPKGKYKVIVKAEDVAQYIQTYDPDRKMDGKDTVRLKKGQHYAKADFGYNDQEFTLARTGENWWDVLIHALDIIMHNGNMLWQGVK